MSASACQRTDTRLFAHPVCQRGIEKLDIIITDIFFQPFVEDRAEEISPFPGIDCKGGQLDICVLLFRRGEQCSVLMKSEAFHNWGELDIVAIYFLEKAIEFQRVIHVVVIDDCHRIVFHAMLFHQFDSLHHFIEGRKSLFVAAIFVMKLLRAVYRNSHEEVVLFEETAPVVVQQCPVCLDAVIYLASVAVLALQLQCFPVETDRTHQRFTTVPGKENLRHRLTFQIFLDEFFQ